jgi:DNA-binding PadR family transcriptional regulator
VLELAILGLLKEQPMHGYELRKQLASKLGFFWTVSFGSLYPTLKKLERRGYVRKTGSDELASRRKQVYAITPAGEEMFLELLEEGSSSSWEEDKFPLRLAFFRYLRPETRLWLLERRKRYLEEKLEVGRSALKRARRGRADSYTLSLVRHGIQSTEQDIVWLDELIATERRLLSEEPAVDHENAGALPPQPPLPHPPARDVPDPSPPGPPQPPPQELQSR